MEQVTHNFPFEVKLDYSPKSTCDLIQEGDFSLYLASYITTIPDRGKVIYLIRSQGNKAEVQVMIPYDIPSRLRDALCLPMHVQSGGEDLVRALHDYGLWLTVGTVEGPDPGSVLEAALSVIPQLEDVIEEWITYSGNSLGMTGWKLLRGVCAYEND